MDTWINDTWLFLVYQARRDRPIMICYWPPAQTNNKPVKVDSCFTIEAWRLCME